MKRGSVSLLACFLLATPLIFAGCGSDSKSNLPTVSKAATDFVGPERCAACHDSVHTEWKDSWHTRKSTYGPNWPGKAESGKAKFLPGVIAMWDNGDVKSHMILDRAPLIDGDSAAGITNRIYVTAKKYNWQDVDIIVGETRKQRYAVYYDGGEMQALYSISRDGGINWQVQAAAEPFLFTGNKERAGYKFLTIEMDALKNPVVQKAAEYGEFYSWQERCIGCHTTGFDFAAWVEAKDDFMAEPPRRDHLKDLFIADIRISCETCHGPGADHAMSQNAADIINPAKLTGEHRKMACEQCHTRTGGNKLDEKGFANDNRGFILGINEYMDVMTYQRPSWGKGSRAVSIDGKGRRDHQQDMDIRLTDHIRGGKSSHGSQACFDCHNSHGVGNVTGYSTAAVDKIPFTFKGDETGTVRLKVPRQQLCGACHFDVSKVLGVLNGQTGFGVADGYIQTGYPRVDPPRGWGTPFGRGDAKQHIFATDRNGYSFGLYPSEYVWLLKQIGGVDQDATVDTNWEPIWPWEVTKLYSMRTTKVAEKPWE